MNRQIKFRGKNKTGQWVIGYYVQHPSGTAFIVRYATSGAPEWHEVDPNTVGQYTGLKDVNGVEIYEGDIIESVFMPIKPSENDQVILGVVEWWAERAEYIVNCNNIDDFDIKALRNRSGYKYADGKFTMSFALKGKVVGNVHDNPELMKGDEK